MCKYNNDSVPQKSISEAFYRLRGEAIICVVFAHCAYSNVMHQRISSVIGLIGVPVFLFLNGVFFSKKNTWNEYLTNIVKRIIVPWILFGFCTYILNIILAHKSFSVADLLLWCSGHMTWLYYVFVYVVCSLIFRINNNKLMLCFWVIISVITNIIYVFEIIPLDGYITAYQNPLNWIGYYALGILLSNYLKEYYPRHIFLKAIICFIILLPLLYFFIKGNENISYWHPFAYFFELISAMMLYYLSFFITSDLLSNIGQRSYFIYFVHMQIVLGFVNRVLGFVNNTNNYVELLFVFVKPIVIVLFSYFLSLVLEKILIKLNLKDYSWFFGFKI